MKLNIKMQKIISVLILTGISSNLYSFELLNTSIGAESTSLGGAVAATVKDPSAIYWNPAGLANINGQEKAKKKESLADEAEQKFADDSFDKLFDDNKKDKEITPPPVQEKNPFELQLFTSYSLLSFDRHLFMAATAFTLFNGTFGIGALGTFAPGISGYDSSGNSTGNLTYSALAPYIAYSWKISIVKVGASFSGYMQSIDTENFFGGGLNLGIQMTPIPILHIGAYIQNLPGVMQQSSSNPSDLRKMDPIARISLAITTPPPDASLMLLVGLESNLGNIMAPEVYSNLGIQVKFAKYFSIRAGLRDTSLALGFGFELPFLKISYAVNQDRLQTSFQHFVDVNFVF